MTKFEKQTLADLLKKAIEDADQMFKTKEQSDAYIIGALQGTIKAVINHLENQDIAKFRFETEVQVKATIEYIIEADSLEEALEQLQSGEHRCDGITFDEQYDWESELIIVEEKLGE